MKVSFTFFILQYRLNAVISVNTFNLCVPLIAINAEVWSLKGNSIHTHHDLANGWKHFLLLIKQHRMLPNLFIPVNCRHGCPNNDYCQIREEMK